MSQNCGTARRLLEAGLFSGSQYIIAVYSCICGVVYQTLVTSSSFNAASAYFEPARLFVCRSTSLLPATNSAGD
ncbi:hypothetical protein BDW69DRAFT_71633 [Aspergillus filifer]